MFGPGLAPSKSESMRAFVPGNCNTPRPRGPSAVASTDPLLSLRCPPTCSPAQRVAHDMGLPELSSRAVGGASDGNLTAAAGVPTLDGLGAVGDGAHADHEWASVSGMDERARLLAGLLSAIGGAA